MLDQAVPTGGWCGAFFSPEAVDLLASRCFTTSIRRAIGDLHDAYDHLDNIPDQIGREHLVDVIDE